MVGSRKLGKSRWLRLSLGVAVVFFLGVILHSVKPLPVWSHGDLPAFTVEAVKTWAEGEGRAKLTEAFRSDGSRAKWHRSYAPPRANDPGAQIEIGYVTLRAAEASFLVLPEAESVSTFPLTAEQVRHLSRRIDCESSSPDEPASSLGSSAILGFPVLGRSWSVSDAQGQSYVTQLWMAPGLNCYPLRIVTQKRDPDGNLRVVQTMEAASVKLGEPEAKLFEVPAQYVERPPSAALLERARRLGASLPEITPGSDPWDEIYRRTRQ